MKRLRTMPIGLRLRVFFGCILVLMVAASSVSLWYLHTIRKRVEDVSLVEQRMTAVLQIDNSMLKLMSGLNRVAESRDDTLFFAEATRLLQAVQSETEWASSVLRGEEWKDWRQEVVFDSLSSMLETLPVRVRSLADL